MSYQESIESQIGKNPADIDAGDFLLEWYGPSSLACHIVRPINNTSFDAYFLIPPQLCGPMARLPMFDHLAYQDDKFVTRTEPDDAKEHLIKDVGQGVVPGHNLAGLFFEGGSLVFNQGKPQPFDLMLASYFFIRYKGLVRANQDLSFTGPMQQDERSIQLTPTLTHNEETRAIGRNIRLEVTETLDEETKLRMLAQHWFPEMIAQGLGVAKSHLLKREGKLTTGRVPVLLECGKSWFNPTPIKSGELARSRLDLFDSVDTTAYGNAQLFVGNQPIAGLEKLLVEFIPIEKVFPDLA